MLRCDVVDGDLGGEPAMASEIRARQAALWRVAGRALAAALVVSGLAFAAFDAFVARPQMTAFARAARPVAGRAMSTPRAPKGPPHRGPWAVSVDDAELGVQLVDGDGAAREGAPVAVLCSTPAGRCERRAAVEAYARWPWTPSMLRAVATLAAGLVAGGLSRRARRPP